MRAAECAVAGLIVFVLVATGCATSPTVSSAPVAPAPDEQPASPPSSDPSSAPASPAAGDGEESAAPLTNTLRWTTASEVDNFGFDIYRALEEDGPFHRMTPEPLLGAGTTDEPQSYVWIDDSIEADTPYYYYIESISLTGERERFSPIIEAPAKSVQAP